MSAIDEILTRAKCMVQDGHTDVDYIIRDSLETESVWTHTELELISDVVDALAISAFFDEHFDEILEHVKGEISDELEDYIDSHEEE